jgi:uncharacterized protein YdeI (YjbR/CyaY-like superfamily)
MTEHKGLPVLAFKTRAAFEQWLSKHGTTSRGIWLKFAKKASGVASVSKADAIEAAIAFGWIDGQINPLDDRFWLTRFTPRGPKSKWSEVNRATAIKLVAEGRMTAAGKKQVELAKADGRWEAAYAPQSRAEVPEDLQAALEAVPAAKAFFETLRGANRYSVLYRIHDAKTPKTRAARIEKFVAMLAAGETLHPSK